jgi:hypothetical protein
MRLGTKYFRIMSKRRDSPCNSGRSPDQEKESKRPGSEGGSRKGLGAVTSAQQRAFETQNSLGMAVSYLSKFA